MAQIQVPSGAFDFEIPRVTLGDIAHNLSFVCRYGGSCDVFWSVGQHIILANEIKALFKLPKHLNLPLLLHDAPEYVLGDANGKFKQHLTGWYLDHETSIEIAVAKKFGFEASDFHDPVIKRIDAAALYVESKALFMNRTPELWAGLDAQFDSMPELKPYIQALLEARTHLMPFIEVENEFKRLVLEEIAN